LSAVNTTLGVVIRGSDEERIFLNIEQGRMTPAESAKHAPLFTLIHDPDSFEAFVAAAGESILGFLGGLAGLGQELRLTTQRMENLSLLRGALHFELRGEGGFALTAHFGSDPIPATPDCTLIMDREVYQQLREGKLEAQTAFLTGAVEIQGDMQLAIQLALAALAPD
jgi:hypothetical protein